MKKIRKRLSKKFGYNVTDSEILNDYRNGFLILSDKEEEDLLTYFNY